MPLPAVRGEIEFRGVSLDYGSGPALAGVDLLIPAGATIAVVGHTGSGKSTLASLVPRLMDPTAGDGPGGRHRCAPAGSRATAASHRLRSAGDLSVQRHHRPEHRFRRGIGHPARQIRRAAEIAGLAADIEGFPDGYQTMVGERGITLSGGQKQRTAIARAILRDPRILILDDALSSVDTLTEERILTHLAGVMRGRTVILISHRVSTVRQAD